MAKVFIGTSGFYYPHWRGSFYPDNLKKDDYFYFYTKNFNTVEVNSSFYHTLRPKTVENWVKKAPADFVFSFKMSRFLTHVKKLSPTKDSINIFFNSLKIFYHAKTKPLILIQTPPALKVNKDRLKKFLKMLPVSFLYAFEFRHGSWFDREVYKILEKGNDAVVLSDSPIKTGVEQRGAPTQPSDYVRRGGRVGASEDGAVARHLFSAKSRLWPYVNINTANFFYIRLHGSQRLFASSYTDEELKFYRQLIKEKLKKGLDVYVYFNNDAEGYAITDGKRLKNFLLDF